MLIAAGWPETARRSRSPGTAPPPISTPWSARSARWTADLKAAGVSLLTAHGPAVAVVGDGVAAQRDAVLVRDQAAVRLAGAGAADQGAGRARSATCCGPAARCPSRCRPSRSSRRGPRSRWSARSRGWSPAGTSGSRSPRSNAVRPIREKFEEYGLDARAFAGVKVAAVGEQTAAALRRVRHHCLT